MNVLGIWADRRATGRKRGSTRMPKEATARGGERERERETERKTILSLSLSFAIDAKEKGNFLLISYQT